MTEPPVWVVLVVDGGFCRSDETAREETGEAVLAGAAACARNSAGAAKLALMKTILLFRPRNGATLPAAETSEMELAGLEPEVSLEGERRRRMELVGLEPTTSWVRSRRSPN
jgi:hypothetical protein